MFSYDGMAFYCVIKVIHLSNCVLEFFSYMCVHPYMRWISTPWWHLNLSELSNILGTIRLICTHILAICANLTFKKCILIECPQEIITRFLWILLLNNPLPIIRKHHTTGHTLHALICSYMCPNHQKHCPAAMCVRDFAIRKSHACYMVWPSWQCPENRQVMCKALWWLNHFLLCAKTSWNDEWV